MEYEYIVSIIIPVYNAEKGIRDCIDSVLEQTYKNIELILVDDGSTDNSGLICDEYAKKDQRITVIHQENFGPSIARNNGIKAATGKYIQFVDADDYVALTMTSILVNAISGKKELAMCGYNLLEINGGDTIVRKITPFIKGTYEYKEFIQYFGELYENSLINSPCNKLYIAEIIKKYDIHFVEDLSMGEDLLFNLDYIKVCKTISIVNEPLYNYLKLSNNSLTTRFQQNLFENQQMLFQKIKVFLVENNAYVEGNKFFVGTSYTNSIIDCLCNLFHKDSNLTNNDIKEQINIIIFNDCVRKSIIYFKKCGIKKQLIGYLIEYKFTGGIYWLFKIRNILRKGKF